MAPLPVSTALPSALSATQPLRGSSEPLSQSLPLPQCKPHYKPQYKLWLCLRFPQLPLHALGVRTATTQRLSAVIEANRIVAATDALQLAGVCSGMTVSHGRMLVPAIEYLERKPSLEQAHLQQLAHWAYRYSPVISPYRHSLLLDIGGCLRLFDGFSSLYRRICNDLAALGLEALAGVACTAKAAYVLSYAGDNGVRAALSGQLGADVSLRTLGQAPLGALDSLLVGEQTVAHLRACGFACVQDIVDIPAAELGQRFGAALLDYLDRLLGRKPDPQQTIAPPETFYQQCDFSEPIHNRQWIDQCLAELLQQLCDFLRRRQLHCQGFDWHFYDTDNTLLEKLELSLAAKQNSLRVFKRLTDLQLEKITFRRELTRIELSSNKLLPMRLLPDDFFNPGTGCDEVLQLIDKLKTRLGRQAVVQLQVCPEYLPELRNRSRAIQLDRNSASPAPLAAKQHSDNKRGRNYKKSHKESYNNSQRLHAAAISSTAAESLISGEYLSSQPVWLLPTPQRMTRSRSGLPCELANNGIKKIPVQLIHGPDRITSHWWRNSQRRDYFIARQRDGRLLWIFFDLDRRQWFLHGFFG